MHSYLIEPKEFWILLCLPSRTARAWCAETATRATKHTPNAVGSDTGGSGGNLNRVKPSEHSRSGGLFVAFRNFRNPFRPNIRIFSYLCPRYVHAE